MKKQKFPKGWNEKRVKHLIARLDARTDEEWMTDDEFAGTEERVLVMPHHAISDALHKIFEGIDDLKAAFGKRSFTIDGRLVGDVGEVIAAIEYDIQLHDSIQPCHDGATSDGRKVQIKATFKDCLTFRTVPEYYLGLKLHRNGSYEEVFNGPGKVIYDYYVKRKGIGKSLLSFPISVLRCLSDVIQEKERIPRRQV